MDKDGHSSNPRIDTGKWISVSSISDSLQNKFQDSQGYPNKTNGKTVKASKWDSTSLVSTK